MSQRGRPRKEGSKNKRCELRLTEEEIHMLDQISSDTNVTRSDILRNALKTTYQLHKIRMGK